MVNEVLSHCDNCPFKSRLVGSKGPIESPLVVVGESPGKEELKHGEPFVGPSGQLLAEVIGEWPVEPFVINAINCFPGKQKDPKKIAQACMACRSRVLDAIRLHPRKLILTLGAAAIWSVTGDTSLRITKDRGRIFESDLAEKGIVASFHPAFMLRGGGSIQQFKNDLDLAVHLFKGGEPNKPIEPEYVVIKTENEFHNFVNTALKQKYIAADIETGGFNHQNDEILMLGIAWDPALVYIIPEKILYQTISQWNLKRLLESDGPRWIWHNGKFDVKFFWQYAVNARIDEDTMLCSYSLNERGGIHGLEQASADWINAPNWKGMLESYLPNKKTSYRVIPKHILYKYGANDVSDTLQLFHVIRAAIRQDPITDKLYTRTLIPAAMYLAQVEMNGIRVCMDRVRENQETLTTEMESQRSIIEELAKAEAGYTVNPGSPKQLKQLLYEDLGLRIGKKKPTSTDADTLEQLPPHPIVLALKRYRKLAKGLGTYVNSVENNLFVDGRIHPTFNIHGTQTGRLSCSNPNIQNIPRDPVYRGQFIAREGHWIVEIDLAQAELRSLAELSNDKKLLEIFASGISLHDVVATKLFSADFNKEQKMIAKNVNFGIVYGITPFGLYDQIMINGKRQGSELDITIADAKEWIDGWYDEFPQAADFINKCREAPTNGITLRTPFGRKRRFGVVSQERLFMIQNEASNFPHQSIASDIMLHMSMRAEPWLRNRFGALVVNNVHDSILFEIPQDEEVLIEASKYVIQGAMEIPPKWGLARVPFECDVEYGTRWGYLEKYALP